MKHDSIIKNGTVVFPFHGEVKCDIGIRLYDLRHTTATLLLSAGETG